MQPTMAARVVSMSLYFTSGEYFNQSVGRLPDAGDKTFSVLSRTSIQPEVAWKSGAFYILDVPGLANRVAAERIASEERV